MIARAALMATGGYYRQPYNCSGLLPVLGLSWDDDIFPMLDHKRMLPIDGARHFLTALECRPISPSDVEDAGDPVEMTAHWTKRREILMALLRRSIETNEPLHVS